ncbi:aquaporin-like protein [Cantharellus anzutake]|uniref:aquaporin-like protein n=1 Tax=Cantharellus anzutake TaxID=1750568 RepID=UPI0019056B1C|nr:aquaporin-like protein [Cantharellus anzutake]KAF8317787.1 aquaporin-like protein [Cantharellus anzutake]
MYDYLAMVGEFIGTFLFLWLAFTGDKLSYANVPDNTTILFIALSFGMALTVTCWCFFRVTGAAFNPAVTLSLWFIGGITTFRAILVFFAQMIGGIAAAAISKGLTVQRGPIGFSVVNKTANGVSNGQALGIEMFTTSVLVFSVLMLAAEKHRSTFLAPVCIGLALFIGHLASIGWTGAGMNPARSFGPSVVNGDFPSNAWVYYLGQLLGAFLATLICAS